MLAGFGRFLVLLTLAILGALMAPAPLAGALAGAIAGGAVLALEALAGKSAPRRVLSGSFGLLVGLVLAALAGAVLAPGTCLLYTSPSPRDRTRSRMPSSA